LLTGVILGLDGRHSERITENLVDVHLLQEAGTSHSGSLEPSL
jgi:hypothetical protein